MALGYEWGSFNRRPPMDASPDHAAHAQVGSEMGRFAGKFGGEPAYPGKLFHFLIMLSCF